MQQREAESSISIPIVADMVKSSSSIGIAVVGWRNGSGMSGRVHGSDERGKERMMGQTQTAECAMVE